MAPLTVLEAFGAVSTGDGATVEVRTPTNSRAGLFLIAFVLFPPDSTLDAYDDGWSIIGSDDGLVVMFRAATNEEPSSYAFTFEGALDAAYPPPMAALVLATGVAGSDVVDIEATAVNAGGPDFTASGGTLTTYSDAAFILFYAAADDGFDDLDGSILTLTGTDGAVDGSLVIGWEMPEAAGPIGDRTATLLGGSPCNGIVAQVVVAAAPPAHAARWDGDRQSIGLPLVGV